ncbi:hypothetical protein SAMN04490243_0513 [Robiginitalea myxolifaciens]|uniref:SIMPL domain-containing protein n=1 Tax=Robiginitalea myxolifaciens TaxID=400055 RepID=A0A1I6FRK5_9FLAO|nr:SIMPL domain-containing protein [Robiginitalea myxolifaciens]SFR32569.1 hypothetical protein SAMN04490243_0513 [Robiginitalea myxolifaciens]
MKKVVLPALFLLISASAIGQQKNFLDMPYLETSAKVDTLVVPDRIYLQIVLQESDTKGRISVEELEERMANALELLGIDLKKQLAVSDISSDFMKYFLRGKEVLKDKSYELLLYTARDVGQVVGELEKLGIANVSLSRTEYSDEEGLELALKKMAVEKARTKAKIMVETLDQQLGRAIHISDGGFYVRSQAQPEYSIRTMAAQDTEMAFAGIDSDFQRIRMEAQVQVKFAIE